MCELIISKRPERSEKIWADLDRSWITHPQNSLHSITIYTRNPY
ncbi:hypothetical protein MmTuc01_2439 [Methanosarcina mazei Tuc01]|uniref:Uncharacterized protein n=1 Tax=Methanosarcina mazei Tuc01 TaxID=1236903 RepID=M1QL76_METMZ|nr:hypothetical protein MmTuc01_2439 [Methanosarcina mazei Tuc01]